MNKEEKLNHMKKRIEDDLFWLVPIATHLLEVGDINGAYRVVSTLNDLELFKMYVEEFKEEVID